jgi:NADPH:quinone reductase-like Zn-dependent oxidoreductase
MRAAILHTPGRPPSYGDHPTPTGAPGLTVLRVTAAPVVPLDLLCASGTSYFGVPETPYVPGGQGVGIVESSDVVEAGTRAWFFATAGMKPGDGTMAERSVVPNADVVPIDAAVPDELAAAVGLSGVAAWMALSWRARLQPGERVLILGAGGAVGQVGIGAARVLGASSVVAMARPESMSRAEAAGADVVVPLEGEVDVVADALVEHGPFDVVLDPVFGVASIAASRSLAERGRLVNLGSAGGDQATYSSAVLRSRTASVLGYTNNALSSDQRREAITAVLGHAAAGRIRMQYAVHSLTEVEQVWTRVASGQAGSRCVLVP